ncbi:MAG: hypothetical protein M0023_04375 [Desulfobacteraceae bacterium]|nr:hypothetical protein [Desulfobacteraceae bacterium]
MRIADHTTAEAARHGIARSPHWPKVEKAFAAENPLCACCGKGPIQVHHRFPFHYVIALGRPDLELDPRNLISLCESEKGIEDDNHHLLIGHLDDFKSSNMTVSDDVILFAGLTKEQISSDERWLLKKKIRLKLLDQMMDEDKAEFIQRMNEMFPLN